jgi:hypothetical protein
MSKDADTRMQQRKTTCQEKVRERKYREKIKNDPLHMQKLKRRSISDI